MCPDVKLTRKRRSHCALRLRPKPKSFQIILSGRIKIPLRIQSMYKVLRHLIRHQKIS